MRSPALPTEGGAALRAGVVGNWIDNIHVFLPVTALAPALTTLAGPDAAASGALVVVAMLLGRPLGGIVFGQVSDRLGRTRTTRIAIAGTALCALGIAFMPTHLAIGAAALTAVLALRFLGGIFVAGEYSAAIPLAMEWSPPHRRGLMSGLILSMAPWAQATIAFATAVLLTVLGGEAYATGGWRVLFVVGALLSGGMFAYYSRHVTDAPLFHRRSTDRTRAPAGLRDVVLGRHAPMFWQVFVLMSGLWLLTDVTVLVLPGRLTAQAGFPAAQASVVMGVASVAQAVFMVLAGHLSSVVGRRTLLVGWMVLGAVTAPFLWIGLVTPGPLPRAAALGAALQVATVAAYGPIAAYLTERFPTHVRSTGYGMGYSLSLILPALYPFYLPSLEGLLGATGAPLALILLGCALVVMGALLGPRLAPDEAATPLDRLTEGALG